MTELDLSFSDYAAPSWLRITVECLLSTVPPGHLQSLSKVSLTDSASIRKGRTRRVKGRKYNMRECRGFYLAAEDSWPASLVVIVDNVFRGTPQRALRIPIIREVLLANTLYHEIGHHLERTVGAPARGGEDAAEAWSTRLVRQHLRKRHILSYGFFRFTMPIIRRLAKHYRSKSTKRAA